MAFEIVPSPNVFVDLESAGSACCVWKDGLRSYMLSASHVLADQPEGAAILWKGVIGGTGLGQILDPSFYWMSSHGGQLDAGLAAITNEGPFATSVGYPWGQQVMSWEAIDSVRSVIVCGKRGSRFARFTDKVTGRHEDHRLLGRLLRFRFDTDDTEHGDSGAPVISLPEGMLVGMHIGVDNIDPRFSLAVAAADIQEAFAQRLPGFALRP